MTEMMGYEKSRRFTVDWHNKLERVVIGGKEYFYKSQQEKKWANYLQLLKDLGEITDWFYEPAGNFPAGGTFWFLNIKRGVRSYKPDFKITLSSRPDAIWHEVKVHLVGKDITKFRRMAKYYPNEKLILVLNRPPKKQGQRNLLRQAEKYVYRVMYANDLLKGL